MKNIERFYRKSIVILFRSIFVFLLNSSFIYADSKVEGFNSEYIQKAIDDENARGGGIVYCPKGVYELRNAIYLKDNVKLVGEGAKTVLKKCFGFATPIIAEIAKGDSLIYVKDASSFKVGDGITVFSESLKRNHSWVTEIVEIFSNAFRLKDKSPVKVDLLSKPFVFGTFPCIYCKDVQNVSVHHLSVDGNRLENPVIDSWWDSGIGCKNVNNIDIFNIIIHDSAGDGISLNNAHNVSIKDSVIDMSARLGIHVGGGSRYTYIGDSRITRSGQCGEGGDGLYLCFGGVFGFYENNIIQNNVTGLSIGRWDSGNIFFNNKITNNSNGIDFRIDSFETTNIVFLQNDISNNYNFDLIMHKPIRNIFIDKWPKKCFIDPLSSYLYHFDGSLSSWVRNK